VTNACIVLNNMQLKLQSDNHSLKMLPSNIMMLNNYLIKDTVFSNYVNVEH